MTEIFLLRHSITTQQQNPPASLFNKCNRAPDKRGIEDNSKIIFLISQQKHML